MPSRLRPLVLAVLSAGAAWCGLLAAGPAAWASTQVVALPFGDPGWTPLVGDWDGSGPAQIGAYDPSSATFYLGDNNGAARTTAVFGEPHWDPLAGDWNGSGRDQIGGYNPATATFYLGDNNGAAATTVAFGDPNWVPLVGDWNGSGTTQIGAYDPSTATFYLGDKGGAAISTLQFGDANWIPLAGDWDGLGDNNGDAAQQMTFGNPGDVPIAGDWTHSGTTQIGVYRPSTATFYLQEVSAPAPPPPMVTAPVTVPLPIPPRGSRAHPRVRVKIRISWTYNGARTRIHKVQVSRLPRGARITVKCTGRGCPMKRRSARAAHLRILVHHLDGSVYHAGDLLLITVTAPGHVSERALVKIRDGRLPVAALL
jgi:hypothetical protein